MGDPHCRSAARRAPPPQQVAQGAVAAAPGGSAKLEQRTSKINQT